MKRIRDNPDQLSFLPPDLFLTDEQIDNAVIDKVFTHIEDQYILRSLQAGKLWRETIGTYSGGTHPFWWQADKRGIEVFWNKPEKKRLIKPAQILERAKLYKEKPPF